MSKKYNFEYIVIGSGPAGSAAALALAKGKKRVALIEKNHFGGSNINTRDIPYALSLDFSNTFSKLSHYPEFRNQDPTFSLPTLLTRELNTILAIGKDYKKLFENAGVICLNGYANFIDAHTIAIGTKKFTSANFILATGAHLKITDIVGTDIVNYLTPETALKVRRIPKAILVVGAGSTGCEIANYFAELGSKVILMESAERILPREDKEVSETLTNYFTKKFDMMVLPHCKVIALEKDREGKCVIFRNANSEKMIRIENVVLATGSEPILDYGLENAGVKYKETGIMVNKLFGTSAKNIYAIGDCLGKDSSTELTNYEGTILASNLLSKAKNIVNYNGFTRLVKTYPEVATVGFNESDLIRLKRKYKKALINLTELPISKIDNLEYGFVKLLSDKNGHLLGATIVAPNAEYIINEIAIAIRHRLSILEIASTPHIINNYSYLIKLATKKLLGKKYRH
ncbi:NAD(P)/FAD-dependent oxidoreductase [Candidatus Saccharibacteria bacterium]|nr:NAD(P)/FAD-dependent oxidoreductase [Candidatus Saccharibacteria bacterium]